jgi:hypothetical protein
MGCFENDHEMANRSRPARGEADNNSGPTRSVASIGSPRATLHLGPEATGFLTEAGDTTAVGSVRSQTFPDAARESDPDKLHDENPEALREETD